MSRPTRRRLLIAGLAAAAAGPALAQAGGKSVEIGKAFVYLENYLKLPAAERSRFTVAYYLASGGKPATGIKAWIVHGGARTPVAIGEHGRVMRLPTLAQVRGKAMLHLDAPAATQFNMSMALEPLLRPAAELPAADLALGVVQASKGARRMAGLLGLAVPRIERVIFKGAPSGVAILADGRRAPLPLQKGLPVFEPAKLKTAVTLKFPKAPTQMMIG